MTDIHDTHDIHERGHDSAGWDQEEQGWKINDITVLKFVTKI